MLKDYEEVHVKNDEQLVKLAYCSEIVPAQSRGAGIGDLSEKEKEQLLANMPDEARFKIGLIKSGIYK